MCGGKGEEGRASLANLPSKPGKTRLACHPAWQAGQASPAMQLFVLLGDPFKRIDVFDHTL